jgi:molecular chaperone DnaK (HSP70)
LIRRAGIEAKHRLSDQEAASIVFTLPDAKHTRVEIPLTRPEFENLVRPVIARTLPPLRQALADAKLKPGEIEEVVLVGGATRMPMVRRLVEEVFGKKPHTELDPDQVVALGAAVQADILAGGTQDMLLLDVTPLSLGIETLGGAVAKILLRNSTIPASATQMFTTFVDGQTSVDIHVVQGERALVKDCRSLGRFKLRVPPLPAGMPRIEVRFLIDANGILEVTARDVRTGAQQSIEVKPSYGLTDAEVEKMLLESFAHAEEDLTERQAIDARHEAEIVIHATAKALAGPAAQALTQPERLRIETALEELKRVLPSGSPSLIRSKTNELNQATQRLAAVIMDSAVKQALEGKKLDEVK